VIDRNNWFRSITYRYYWTHGLALSSLIAFAAVGGWALLVSGTGRTVGELNWMFPIFRNSAGTAMIAELALDLVLGLIAMLLAAAMAHPLAGLSPLQTVFHPVMLAHALGFAVSIVLLQSGLGQYRNRDAAWAEQALRLLAAVGVAGYISYLLFKVTGFGEHPRVLVGFALMLFVGGVLIVRSLLLLLREVQGPPRVMIVGTGPDAEGLADDMRLAVRTERVVAGFYPVTAEGLSDSASPLFAMGAPLPELVRTYGIDEIVVAVRDHRRSGLPMNDLLMCRSMGIPVHDMSAFYEMTHAEVPLESLKASWLIYGPGFVQSDTQRIVKRAFDIVVSSALLVVTLPVMLVAAAAVKLETKGPLIYRQQRVGLFGESFTCLKFRSMVADAEADGVARWAAAGDHRVTGVGRLLRDTRIDELPQLISVLMGDMSMVGPRPERPEFVEQLREAIPFYDLRHTVKPGLTGWAQVRYTYGDTLDSARRKHQFDLYYVKNNSLLLDVMVLFETISVVLFREGR
jgi:sugar transferase (PEP-CTERM system associated)